MSILTVFSPSLSWYEEDLTDEDEDDEQCPAEALTVGLTGGWWSAGAESEGED